MSAAPGSQLTVQERITVHDPALDGLRGIAVLMVVASHLSKLGIAVSSPLNMRGTGRYGVFLFFVLSSFLLTRQIMSAPAPQLRSIRYWANYALRRFLRIYPAFFVSLLLYMYLYQGGLGPFPASWQEVMAHLTLQDGVKMYWTIPVEFKYYLLLPFVALFFRVLMPSPFAVTACFTLIVGVVTWLAPPKFGHELWSYIPVFVCGDFASWLVLRAQRQGISDRSRAIIEWIGWAGVAFTILLYPFVIGHLVPDGIPYKQFDYTTFHLWHLPWGVAFGAIVVAGVIGTGALRKAACWKPLVMVGRVSYSLYLLHMLAMSWALTMTNSTGLRVVLSLVMAGVLATASYLAIERPLSRVRIKVS